MRKLLYLILLLLCHVHCAAVGYYSTTFSATTTISPVLNVSVGTSSGISFSSITDYLNGKTIVPFVTITIKSNMNWTASVLANDDFFTGGNNDMPCSILSVRKNGSGSSYQTISNISSYNIATGSRTGNTSPYTTTFRVDLNVDPDFNYDGGAYNIGLVYTITGS